MVVSSSNRLLDSLSRQSVPDWLTAQKSSLQPITQGVLVWQSTAEELLASVRHCTHRKAVAAKTATKLWLGYGADSLCSNSWYGVEQVKVIARSRAGAALVNPRNAPPGTVLDIQPQGITVAVLNGAVRLSNFLTPLGRPLLGTQLPLSIGQRLPRLKPFQLRTIAQLEKQIANHEPAWLRRLTQLQPLQLPLAEGEPGLGSIFARLPFDFGPGVVQGHEAFQDCLAQFGGAVLLTVLAAYLQGISGGESGAGVEVGLRSGGLQQLLCSDELAALFASHVPARFGVKPEQSLVENLEVVLDELSFLEQALTHRQDLILGVNPTKLPSLYPVLLEVVAEITELPHRLGQALTIQVTESGEACAWFYNPAVLSSEDVADMQTGFRKLLGAIAQAPEQPFSAHGIG